MAYDYERLKVQKVGRLATVTVSNPPINIITVELYAELAALSRELKADPDLTVVVLKSADPDFFLAHFDVGSILRFPAGTVPERDPELMAPVPWWQRKWLKFRPVPIAERRECSW